MFLFYNFLGLIILIIYPLIFFIRFLNSKEELNRFFEKLSIYKKKNSNKTLWIHAVSIGEVLSIMPIVKELDKNNKIDQILITSSTLSSSKILNQFKFKKTIHQFFPIDTNQMSKRFLSDSGI